MTYRAASDASAVVPIIIGVFVRGSRRHLAAEDLDVPRVRHLVAADACAAAVARCVDLAAVDLNVADAVSLYECACFAHMAKADACAIAAAGCGDVAAANLDGASVIAVIF